MDLQSSTCSLIGVCAQKLEAEEMAALTGTHTPKHTFGHIDRQIDGCSDKEFIRCNAHTRFILHHCILATSSFYDCCGLMLYEVCILICSRCSLHMEYRTGS